jgi:hypothetical protein
MPGMGGGLCLGGVWGLENWMGWDIDGAAS